MNMNERTKVADLTGPEARDLRLRDVVIGKLDEQIAFATEQLENLQRVAYMLRSEVHYRQSEMLRDHGIDPDAGPYLFDDEGAAVYRLGVEEIPEIETASSGKMN